MSGVEGFKREPDAGLGVGEGTASVSSDVTCGAGGKRGSCGPGDDRRGVRSGRRPAGEGWYTLAATVSSAVTAIALSQGVAHDLRSATEAGQRDHSSASIFFFVHTLLFRSNLLIELITQGI